MKKMNGISRALVCWLWPCLLIATPFHLGEENPALSSVPTIAAAGLLAGAAVGRLHTPSRDSANRDSAGMRRMALAGMAASMVALLPEWATLVTLPQQIANRGMYGTGEFVDLAGILRMVQPPLALLLAALCGYAQQRLAPPRHVRGLDVGGAALLSVGYLVRLTETAWYGASLSYAASNPGQAVAYQFLLLAGSFACTALAGALSPGQEEARAEGARPEKGAAAVSHLASGTLLWGLMTRVLNPNIQDAVLFDAVGIISLACIGTFLVSLLVGRFLSKKEDRPAGTNEAEECRVGEPLSPVGDPAAQRGASETDEPQSRSPYAQANPEIAASFEPYGLAPRELEVAIAYAVGDPAASIAQALHIKPGSVRATAQRVYAKMDISSKSELVDLASARGGRGHSAEDEKGDGRVVPEPPSAGPIGTADECPPFIRGIARCGAIGIVVLLTAVAAPFDGDFPTRWGSTRVFTYGCAIGLAARALLGRGGASLPVAHQTFRQVGFIQGRSGQSAASTLGLAARLAGSALLICAASWGMRCGALDRSCVFGLALLGSLCLSATPRLLAERDRKASRSPRDGLLSALVATTSLGLGFAWEELWRVSGWYTTFSSFVPLLNACSLGYALLLSGKGRRAGAATLVAISLTATFAGSDSVLLATALLSFAETVRFCEASGYLTIEDIDAFLLVFAVGVVTGDYSINYAGTVLTGNDVFSAPFGGRGAFSMLLVCAVGAFAALCAAAFLLATRRAAQNDKAARIMSQASGLDRRIEHVLLARGLNQTQVEVAMDVVDGKSSTYIANKRHLSRGAVNSARDAAYKAFGVHSRPDFIAAVAAAAGL